jgi:Domain of unknown function (DUF4136)
MTKMIGFTLMALALATSAYAQDIRYNFDSDADFTKFKTYKWVEIPGGTQLDDLITKQLTTAIEAELSKKGLTKTDSDTADLLVGYQASTSTEKQINAYGNGFGMGPRWGGGMATATTSTLVNGSIAVDMYETASKHLVWRGVATKTLDPDAKPDKRQKTLEKGAEKLFKNYPPPTKK